MRGLSREGFTVEYVVVGILKGYREGEEAVEDLENAGITGGQVQLITDTADDARTIDTAGEKSTEPPKPQHNWLAKLFGKGGALEPVVRADSGSQPDYIGNEEFYATHVKQGGAIIIVRTPAEAPANRAAEILHEHGARTPGQKDGPVVQRVDNRPRP
jgi:hypothetical protein